MITPIIRVSLGFALKLSDDALGAFGTSVMAQLYNSSFPSPPLTPEQLEALVVAFSAARTSQASGGKAATAWKNEKRAELVAGLKELAFYVQVTSANNLATLLSSGFAAVNTNRTQAPLAKPSVERIVPGMEGQALVTLTTDPNKRGCEVEVAEVAPDGAPGVFRPAVFSTSSRKIVISGLIPGKFYVYRGRMLGGSTTYSDWSDPITQRAA